MRLIDADLLILDLHHGIFDDCDCKKDYEYLGVDDYIRNQPTAFDLESVKQKIVELQLSVKDKELSTTDEEFATMLRGRLRGIADCLEIIESAANATNGKNGG